MIFTKTVVSERKCYTVNSKEKGMTGTKYIPVRIVSIGFEFQFRGAFRSINLEKRVALREHLKFFIVNSKV